MFSDSQCYTIPFWVMIAHDCPRGLEWISAMLVLMGFPMLAWRTSAGHGWIRCSANQCNVRPPLWESPPRVEHLTPHQTYPIHHESWQHEIWYICLHPVLYCPARSLVAGWVGRYKEGGLRWSRSESWSAAGGEAGGPTNSYQEPELGAFRGRNKCRDPETADGQVRGAVEWWFPAEQYKTLPA